MSYNADSDEKSDDDISKYKADTNEVDFEKRLQEEVAKIKKQLEEDFASSQKKISSKNTKEEKTESKSDSKSNADFRPRLKSDNKKTPDIDLDEEIRRILS